MEKRKYSDRAEYLKKSVAERRRTVKLKAIELFGGKVSPVGTKRSIGLCSFTPQKLLVKTLP